METEDPFAAVEPDPLTGTTPDAPPVPTSDALPPGVEPGQLGGTAAPDPEAEPETPGTPIMGDAEPPADPEAAGETSGADTTESPSESPSPEAAPEPEPEPETVVDPPVETQPAAEQPKAGKQGGPPSRSYFIFERMEIEVGGEVVDAWVKRSFQNEDTIVARNGPNALRAAGRAIGDGYEGHLVPVPVSMWNPKAVSTKQKDNLSVSVN